MTVHDNKCMRVSNGLAGQKEQKFLQVYTVDIYTRKREPHFPKRDLVTDDDTQLATYIKTSHY
jgi:hypothetical protein